jgi:hypothetical protein
MMKIELVTYAPDKSNPEGRKAENWQRKVISIVYFDGDKVTVSETPPSFLSGSGITAG